MKRNSLIVIMIILAIGIAACGGDKYAKVKKVYTDYQNGVETFLDEAIKAESSSSLTMSYMMFMLAVDTYTKEMKKLKTEFPELQDEMTLNEVLIDLKPRTARINGKIPAARTNLLKYWKKEAVDKIFK